MIPTNNAPNPQKFLNEMKTLVPHLTRAGHIPTGMNREKARANGFKAVREITKERDTQKALLIENEYRLNKIAHKIDDEMKSLEPLLYQIVQWSHWTWLFKLIGYSWNVRGTEEEIDGVPSIQTSIIELYRFGKVKKSIRIVWEDPKTKGKMQWAE